MSGTVKSGFFDSLNGDRKYNTRQLSGMFDGVIADGVFSAIGEHLVVKSTGGMNISVGTGKAWFNRTWTINDPAMPMVAQAADQLRDRIDAVVIDVDPDTLRRNDIIYVKGTPAVEPKRPSMVKDSLKNHYQYPLAYIRVKAGSSAITQDNITNAIGTSECPFASGIMQQMSVEDLTLQWQHEYNNLYAKLESAIDNASQKLVAKGEVSSWFFIHIPSEPHLWKHQDDGCWSCHIDKSIDSQTVGLLASDEPFIHPYLGDDLSPEGVDSVLAAWSEIYSIQTGDGYLLCRAYNIPDRMIHIKLQCVRK